ncbi:MAG: hypothetical protein KU38_13530 [Sulfurovum sp. FS08-3]|nr:MAG: hypothetical protein KU38_13530 [Sulfurovum sp. FS08-3]
MGYIIAYLGGANRLACNPYFKILFPATIGLLLPMQTVVTMRGMSISSIAMWKTAIRAIVFMSVASEQESDWVFVLGA